MKIRSIVPMLHDVTLRRSSSDSDDDKLKGIRQNKGNKQKIQQQPRAYDMTISPNCLKTDFISIKDMRTIEDMIKPAIIVMLTDIEESFFDRINIGREIEQDIRIPEILISPCNFFFFLRNSICNSVFGGAVPKIISLILGSSMPVSDMYSITLCMRTVPNIMNPNIVKHPGTKPPIQSLA
jgi:hypothetical protein